MSGLAPLLAPAASQAQRDAVAAIEDEFVWKGGLPIAVAAGAVVNAYAESGLDPRAKNGPMYGLFQLDNQVGLGQGMTMAELLDARANTRRIVQTIQRTSWGKRIRDAVAAGERHPQRFAYLIARDVERPNHAEEVALHREGLTWSVFPGLVSPTLPEGVEIGGTVSDALVGVSDSQRQAAAVIEASMGAAGLPAAVVGAAIANAWAESRLNPLAVGVERAERDVTQPDGSVVRALVPVSKSVGLFQLNDARGAAGAGMSVSERQDPAANTARMVAIYREGAGRRIEAAYAAGERDVGRLAALWCEDLERPANAAAQGVVRRAYAYRLLPSWVEVKAIADGVATRVRDTAARLDDDGGGGAILLVVGLAGVVATAAAVSGSRKRRR